MKHAVVYVPGSTQHLLPQSLAVVADRLAMALKTERPDLDDVRITHTSGALSLGEASADMARLEGLSAGQWGELVDVYEVNYLETFVKRFTARSSFERAVGAIRVFVANRSVLGRILTGKTKRFLDRLQGAFLALLVVFLAAYLVYWVAVATAGVATALSLGDLLKAADEAPIANAAQAGEGPVHQKVALGAAILVAVMTLAKLAVRSVVTQLERSAIEFYAICEYVRDEGPFRACHAMVRNAVVAARREGYERVDLMSFSLGSIIVGDTIFPRSASLRATPDAVDAWVSIGYPYDIVKAAYPAFFDRGASQALTLGYWWNVTEGEDFLGSNFRFDHKQGAPDPALGIVCDGGCRGPDQNIYFAPYKDARPSSWLDFVPFTRVSNHGLYWNPKDYRPGLLH